MKNIGMKLFTTLTVLLGMALVTHAQSDTSVRYSVDTQFVAVGSDADANGRVQVFAKRQDENDVQRLRIRLAGLDASTSYTLNATLDDGSTVAMTTFTTDESGAAVIIYLQNNGVTQSSQAMRRARAKRLSLPMNVPQVTSISSISVVNGSAETVLSANLYAAESLNYVVSSVFANTGVDADAMGCVAFALQEGTVQFRLFALGQPNSQYTLSVNGQDVTTYLSDYSGRIAVGVTPQNAPSLLGYRTLALKNSDGAAVLETTIR